MAAALGFPGTMVVAPIMALDSDETSEIAPILTGALVVWLGMLFVVRFMQDEKQAETQREEEHAAQSEAEAAYAKERLREEVQDTIRLRRIAPVLVEMLQIVDASYVVNGEIQMDYTRFKQCRDESVSELSRLGIRLPPLNQGGDGAIFKRTLRQITDSTKTGDLAGARRATNRR